MQIKHVKQLSRHASLNHNIYIAADATNVNVHHAAHACHRIVRSQCSLSDSLDPPTLSLKMVNYVIKLINQ